MSSFAAACAVTLLALAALLFAEHRDSRAGVWVAKPLASTAFLAAAWAAGALETGYGRWILAGLALSWWGDVLLIPRARPAFLLGLVAFLLGHVAYTVGFAYRGVDAIWIGAAAVPTAIVLVFVMRWLRPHVEEEMRVPVYAYTIVISAMVLTAVGTVGAHGRLAIAVGALAFYFSDLAVARDRFVAPGFVNRSWGLPLYYGAQLVLASTVR